ncbi:TetR/AcrR family transcriptional regulator [Reinekea sp. G2M2-21]|uniref:TetR/AcrR family transcriptional regulator n=1 Tax=Reinekea sp. G2M2-21 TaxID=2788942 RepID=UPI0018AA4DAE|nr:TetR/AcrR family transcriptional regulator [Reinekea sp. G2M2-21]
MSQRMIYQTDATRQKILDTAEHCFSESGFFETQMKDIAVAVGMSRNTLYRYYRDKFELGLAILEKTLHKRFAQLNAQIDALLTSQNADIPAILQRLFTESYTAEDADLDHRFVAEFDAFYSGERIPADFRERLSNAAGINVMDKIDDLIRRGQQAGTVRGDIEAHTVSAILSNAIQAFHQRMILRNGALIEFEQGQPGQLTPVLIQLLIDGLRVHADTHSD